MKFIKCTAGISRTQRHFPFDLLQNMKIWIYDYTYNQQRKRMFLLSYGLMYVFFNDITYINLVILKTITALSLASAGDQSRACQ